MTLRDDPQPPPGGCASYASTVTMRFKQSLEASMKLKYLNRPKNHYRPIIFIICIYFSYKSVF